MKKTGVLVAAIVALLISIALAGCVSRPTTGYATVRQVDIFIPEGQSPSNLTEIQVIPYLDAYYQKLENVDLQVTAKQAGTDIVVKEATIKILNLTPEKTTKETVALKLENSQSYDIFVTVWADGRMQVSGSVYVYLPDRTILQKKLAVSLLSLSSIDVMSPDISKDPVTLNVILGIENAGAQSGNVTVKIKMLNQQVGLTAVRETRVVGVIAEKSTKEFSLSFSVPNKYDYDLDIQLFEEGAMISQGRGRVTLAPPQQYILSNGQIIPIETKTTSPYPMVAPTVIPTAAPYYEGGAKVGQFQIKSGGQPPLDQKAPGFEAIGAIAGLLLMAYAVSRRGR